MVLHRDPALLPRRERVWSSWNYLSEERPGHEREHVSLSYWMNRLQNLETERPVIVTVNPSREPRWVASEHVYHHPQYDGRAADAQAEIPSLQGVQRTWFAGSYCGYGLPRGRAALRAGGGGGARRSRALVAGDAGAGGRGPMNSALYFGRVTHTRYFPRRHRLSYGVWYLLADLDELAALDRLPGFAVDRPGPISFHTRDHGPRDGSPLRPWIQRYLDEAGIDLEGGAIRILSFPRVVGYVFNPLSVWFCHHRDGASARSCMRCRTRSASGTATWCRSTRRMPGDLVRRAFDKELFVSPFIDMAARYDFTTRVPDERVSIAARQTVAEGQVLTVALTATREPMTSRSLARAFFGYPLVTLKVIGGIHWEALKLWIKGAPYRRRGAPPAHPVTILAPERSTARVA